jgi:Flp pilus assembly protein TadG
MRNRSCQRGSASLLAMLSMIPMCMMLGLVVDVGLMNFTSESAQAAAESAALAAAQAALQGINGGSSYCGSTGVGCQSPAAPCPATGSLQKGCLYATANGFTSGALGGRQTVTIEANVTSPAPTVPGVQVKYWVTVRIIQKTPLTFAGVLGYQPMNVAARATAAVISVTPPDCITALDSSAPSAISITGNANFSMNCGVASDSAASSALSLTGNITLNTTGIQLVGGVSQAGNISLSPSPTTHTNPVSDPFANIPAPALTGPAYYNESITGNSSPTLTPGIYYGGINFTGNINATFGPGTYFLVGGGLVTTGNITLTSSAPGVTFYNTFDATHPYAPINLTGNIIANLSAPSSGPLAGMLFFQDRNAPSKTESITGNSSSNLTGAIYFPNSKLTFTGNSGAASQDIAIVADTVSLTGNTNITSDPLNPSGPKAPKTALIE